MNWTTSCLESRKAKVRFLKAGGWGIVTVNKRKERMVSGQVSFFQDKDLSCRLPFLSFPGEEGYTRDKAHATDYLIGADQPENPKLAD